MKKLLALVFSVSVFLILTNAIAWAQVWPPPCCMLPRKNVQTGMPFLQAKINISKQALQLQGLTRDQLLDRIASIFFPDKKVDLVVLWKQNNSESVFTDSTWIVMSSEQTAHYRTPRSSITKEYLDLVTEIGLTDGESWVKINFVDDPVDPDPK